MYVFEFIFEYRHFVYLYFNWKSHKCIYFYYISGLYLYLNVFQNTDAFVLPTEAKALPSH